MKTKNDFETTYDRALKECIALLNQESNYEKEKISLAFEIGKKTNELVTLSHDKEIIFKRLSRDIFKERGKVISPSKIAEYQQFYLNFQSMDIVTAMEKTLMNDVTIGMLTEMALKDGLPENKPTPDASPLLTILKKANRLLNRFEVAMEDKHPEDEELPKILTELVLIKEKAQI